MGTYNGLARFGGMRFVTFDPVNTPALAHARIRQLYVDNLGTLWINTFDGSMTSFRNGAFTLEWKGDGELDPDASLLSSIVEAGDVLAESRVFRPSRAPLPRAAVGRTGCLPTRSRAANAWPMAGEPSGFATSTTIWAAS